MADDTNTAEREAFEAHCLRTGHSSTSLGKWGEKDDVPTSMRGDYIMRNIQNAWLAFQAGRASLAASAGSEPVAWVDERVISWLANSRSRSATISTTLEKAKSSERPMPLYTHPSPPEGMAGWTKAAKQLPPCGDDRDFIGINTAGFAGVFNAVRVIDGNTYCLMETAEESVSIMSDLDVWKPFIRPPLPASEAKEL